MEAHAFAPVELQILDRSGLGRVVDPPAAVGPRNRCTGVQLVAVDAVVGSEERHTSGDAQEPTAVVALDVLGQVGHHLRSRHGPVGEPQLPTMDTVIVVKRNPSRNRVRSPTRFKRGDEAAGPGGRAVGGPELGPQSACASPRRPGRPARSGLPPGNHPDLPPPAGDPRRVPLRRWVGARPPGAASTARTSPAHGGGAEVNCRGRAESSAPGSVPMLGLLPVSPSGRDPRETHRTDGGIPMNRPRHQRARRLGLRSSPGSRRRPPRRAESTTTAKWHCDDCVPRASLSGPLFGAQPPSTARADSERSSGIKRRRVRCWTLARARPLVYRDIVAADQQSPAQLRVHRRRPDRLGGSLLQSLAGQRDDQAREETGPARSTRPSTPFSCCRPREFQRGRVELRRRIPEVASGEVAGSGP